MADKLTRYVKACCSLLSMYWTLSRIAIVNSDKVNISTIFEQKGHKLIRFFHTNSANQKWVAFMIEALPRIDNCRNVDKNARSLVLSYVQASCALKWPETQRLPTSRNDYVSVVVSVQRSAPSVQFTSSICPRTLRPKSPIGTPQTVSNSTDYQCLVLDKCLGWLEPTVLERVRLWRSSQANWSQTWEDMIVHLTGKRYWSISEVPNYKVSAGSREKCIAANIYQITSPKFLKTIWKPS